MASANSVKIIRAPGRVVIGPTTSADSGSFPFGGTEIGRIGMFALASNGDNLTVEPEGLSRVADVLEGSIRFSVSFQLRGWDDDAIELLFPDQFAEGDLTRHAVFAVPGVTKPGSSALARAQTILFVPDDPVNVPALIVYRGVPDWRRASDVALRRNQELAIPVAIEAVQDDSGRILAMGRIHDLEIP